MVLASTNFILGSTSNFKVTKKKEKSGVLQQFDFNLPQEIPSEGTVVLFFSICSAYIRKVGNSEGKVSGTVGRTSGVYAKTAENF